MRELLRQNDEELDMTDRGYVESRSLGVVKFLNTIDYVTIRALGRRNLSDLSNRTQNLLRLATFEGRWAKSPMTSILTVLQESPELARVVDKAIELDLEKKMKNLSPSNALGVKLSHPSFLVDTFLEHLGRNEAINLMNRNNGARDYFFRLNTLLQHHDEVLPLLESEGVVYEPESEIAGLFRVVSGINSLFSSVVFKEGRVLVQDKGSVIVGRSLDIRPRLRVWDACAAPGMKTHLLWESMKSKGELVASDINHERLEVAKRRCSALGCEGVKFVEADAATAPVSDADKILIDAPCTSTGILRSHPSYKWRLNKAMLMSIMSIQNKILDGILSAYSGKPGTEIIFATCSLLPHEGESQIDSAMKRHQFELLEIPYKGSPGYSGFECSDKVIRLFPHRQNSNGFFIARMRITE
ncbi:MAG: methyltransferase domain-containing protein [Candidatus Thorarchaeota archaeon]|jgi:16S rRNA (cytosine967-C5)-methyltransferase